MTFFGNLFGFTERDQNAAQVRQQVESAVEIGVGHDEGPQRQKTGAGV
jgi:hypothetical protein